MGIDPLTWEADNLGAFATIHVNTGVYGKTAIFKTAYWYTDRCYLFLSKPDDAPEIIRVEVRPKGTIDREELVRLCREFCNSLVDQQVRQDVITETGSIRDSLVKKAFFEGTDNTGTRIDTDHKNVPEPNDSFSQDRLKIGRATGT